MRIIDDALWQEVRDRQAELSKIFAASIVATKEANAKRPHTAHRPSFLLSGLLACGVCQGGYGIVVGDRYGCLNHHRRGSCENNRTIRRPMIEQRVLSGLTERLVPSEAVAAAVRAYQDELNRLKQERQAQNSFDRQALAKVERAIASVIDAIEAGLYQPSMKARMADLEQQKAEIVTRMETVEPVLPDVNPNIAEIYRRKVACLTDGHVELETNMEAAMAIRSLIGEVVLNPGEKRGEVHATLRGELMAILEFAAGRNTPGTLPSRVITGVGGSPRNNTRQTTVRARFSEQRGQIL